METPKQPIPAILDYARPTPLAEPRIAAKSIITITPAEDGIDIVEKSTGRPQAIAVMVIAGACAFVLGLGLLGQINEVHDQITVLLTCGVVYAVIAGGTVMVMLAVIDIIWGCTILEIRPCKLTLISSSPLKRRLRSWDADQILSVSCILESIDEFSSHEIQIEVGTERLQLFADHPKIELDEIASMINQCCGLLREKTVGQ